MFLHFGDREKDVLSTLWELGPSTVTDARDTLSHRGIELEYTTVQTLLNRLEKKGAVRRDRAGRAHVYEAVVERSEVALSELRELAHRLFEGSIAGITSFLVEERLDGEELSRLEKLIRKKRGESRR